MTFGCAHFAHQDLASAAATRCKVFVAEGSATPFELKATSPKLLPEGLHTNKTSATSGRAAVAQLLQRLLLLIPVSAKKNSSREEDKKTRDKTSFRSTKSGDGEQLLLLGCKAKARLEGVLFFADAVTADAIVALRQAWMSLISCRWSTSRPWTTLAPRKTRAHSAK